MKTREQIQARIVSLMHERLDLAVPSTDTNLLDSGLLDSLVFVNLLVQLEQEFHIPVSIEDIELDDFRTVAGIADFLAARGAAAEVR